MCARCKDKDGDVQVPAGKDLDCTACGDQLHGLFAPFLGGRLGRRIGQLRLLVALDDRQLLP